MKREKATRLERAVRKYEAVRMETHERFYLYKVVQAADALSRAAAAHLNLGKK